MPEARPGRDSNHEGPRALRDAVHRAEEALRQSQQQVCPLRNLGAWGSGNPCRNAPSGRARNSGLISPRLDLKRTTPTSTASRPHSSEAASEEELPEIEDRETDARRLRTQGRTVPAIAGELGVSEASVWRSLRKR